MEDLVIATRQDQSRNRQITWLLCIIASVAVLVCALHGLGMDEDSTAYLSGAVNLAKGRGLTAIGGSPYTLFGPALASFVSLGVRLGASAQATDLFLNVACAVATVILGRVLLQRHVANPRLVLAGSVFIAIGWPLIQVTSLAITEPLTIVVLLALVLLLEDYNLTKHPVMSLAGMVVLLNLAFFLRYAGLGFIPVTVFVVFISRRHCDSFYRRGLAAGAVTALAFLGPALWMVRNHSVDGSLLGPRFPPVFGVTTIAHQYVLAIGKIFLPGPNVVEDLVFAVVIVAIGMALRLVYVSSSGGLGEFLRRLGPWSVLLYVCVSYVLYLYAAELSTKIDPIDSRLLVPIYVPSVILMVGLLDAVLSRSPLSTRSKRLLGRLLLLYLCVQLLISCVLVGDFALNGRDFTSTAWRTSTLVTATKSVVKANVVYTNNPSGLWARLDSNNIRSLPTSLAKAKSELSCPGVRIVFFTQGIGHYYGDSGSVAAGIPTVTLRALRSVLELRTTFTSDQGEIVRINLGATTQANCP